LGIFIFKQQKIWIFNGKILSIKLKLGYSFRQNVWPTWSPCTSCGVLQASNVNHLKASQPDRQTTGGTFFNYFHRVLHHLEQSNGQCGMPAKGFMSRPAEYAALN
jgi:hypothetical protein